MMDTAIKHNVSYEACTVCPRACGVNRAIGELGVCKAPAELHIGRAALHWWEEPCLVGEQGSGAVFFSYCPLGCVYCQNEDLVAGAGIEVGFEQFKQTLLRLQNEEHAANINLVTPSHYVPTIAEALRQLRKVSAEEFPESNVVDGGSSGDRLVIPVVYNTSSYDSVESLRQLKGLIDIYLADFKYVSPEVARKLSHAASYPEVALAALDEMVVQVGFWSENAQGLLERGIIVRHLVLPGHIEESFQVLRVLHERYGSKIRLSIMNQYTPLRGDLVRYGLSGKVSNEEYESVLDYADYLGIEDYFWQEGGAATESFIPTFDGTGVISK